MARYTHHGPCEICGSRDNRAWYDDGSSFCFGCRKPSRATKPGFLFNKDEEVEYVKLPDDCTFPYNGPGYDWITSFGITVSEILHNKILWSEQRQQLIFPFYHEKKLLAFQARNFAPSSTIKYFTRGKLNEVYNIYSRSVEKTTRLVLIEDCVSAIKIARQVDAMPCLGSDLPIDKINRLADLYDSFLIWLDYDMYPRAWRLQDRFKLLGKEAHVISTEQDPKMYNDEEIKGYLK